MQADFAGALSLVLKSEGGFVNNPHDPGGATNYGITQRVEDAYRRSKNLPLAAVRYIPMTDVIAIYQAQYWGAVRGDELPQGLDYCLFDEAANSGPVKSIKDLQAALGVKVDGQFGLVTLTTLQAVNDRAALINRICDLRLSFLHRLLTWRFFGKGWSSRIQFVRTHALLMVGA